MYTLLRQRESHLEIRVQGILHTRRRWALAHASKIVNLCPIARILT